MAVSDVIREDLSVMAKLLRVVAKTPVDRGWLSLVDRVAAVLRHYRAYESHTSAAAGADGVDADATATLVQHVSRSMSCLQSALKSHKPQGSHDDKRYFDIFAATVKDVLFTHVLHSLEAGIRQVVLGKVAAAASRLEELQAINRGGAHGRSWHDGHKEGTCMLAHGALT